MDNDNITRLILHGINLAKELEANLHNNLANQPPETVSASCEEIIRVFTRAREMLLPPPSSSSLQPHSLRMIQEPLMPAGSSSGGSIQDWLMGRSSAGQALDLFHAQVSSGGEAAAAAAAAGSGGEVAESSRGLGGGPSSSSSQSHRRR